jgi:hypothetical protein
MGKNVRDNGKDVTKTHEVAVTWKYAIWGDISSAWSAPSCLPCRRPNNSLDIPVFTAAYFRPSYYSICDKQLQLTDSCTYRQSTHPHPKSKGVSSAECRGHGKGTSRLIHFPENGALRLRPPYGKVAVRHFVNIHVHRYCDPLDVITYDFTALQKAGNTVNRQIQEK